MVPPAAAETNRCCEDDRASYKDTHGSPPSFVRCFPGTIIRVFPRGSCDTWDTLWKKARVSVGGAGVGVVGLGGGGVGEGNPNASAFGSATVDWILDPGGAILATLAIEMVRRRIGRLVEMIFPSEDAIHVAEFGSNEMTAKVSATACSNAMSALGQKLTMRTVSAIVRFVPLADIHLPGRQLFFVPLCPKRHSLLAEETLK
jgi:hypothetical protein